MGNIKILQVIPSLAKGGAERLVLDICNELTKRQGVEVRLLIFRDVNDYQFSSQQLDIKIINSGVNLSILGKNELNLSDYTAEVKKFSPDIIHSHLFEAETVTRGIIFEGVKYFTHVHSNFPALANFNIKTLFEKSRLVKFYEKRWIREKYRRCNNHFIAISTDCKNYIHQTLGNEFEVCIIPNAIDLSRFTYKNEDKTSEGKVSFVTTGSLRPKKNQVFIIKAMSRLKSRGMSNFELHILGDGPDRTLLENEVSKHRLETHVKFHGLVDKPEEFLQKSYLYLHGAKYEPFGLVLIEAMACGNPVVTTDGAGNRDIIEDGKNGFMVAQGDLEGFVNRIELLLKDQHLYKKMQAEAIAFSKKFDIKNYVDKLLDYYNEA